MATLTIEHEASSTQEGEDLPASRKPFMPDSGHDVKDLFEKGSKFFSPFL